MKHFKKIYNYYFVDGITKADAESLTYVAVREKNKIYKAAVAGELVGTSYKRRSMKVTYMGSVYTKLDRPEGTLKTIFSKMGITLVALQTVNIALIFVAIYAIGVGLSQ